MPASFVDTEKEKGDMLGVLFLFLLLAKTSHTTLVIDNLIVFIIKKTLDGPKVESFLKLLGTASNKKFDRL